MRSVMLMLAAMLGAGANYAMADVREDYALLTTHIDASTVAKRTGEGRVLEFIDVLGRRNRCAYAENGHIKAVRYASAAGDFTIRFVYDKRVELTSIVLADRTVVAFRNGKMQPSSGKPTLAESYAAALEHWLATKNSGL
jgi:hypothetical protein